MLWVPSTPAAEAKVPETAVDTRPSRRFRLAVAAVVALFAVCWNLLAIHSGVFRVGDIEQALFGARAMLAGHDPYRLVGPGRAFDWPWPLYYPGTALAALIPLAWLPRAVARLLFVGFSAGALGYALSARGRAQLPAFVSSAFLVAAGAAQWSPLLTAGSVTPALAWLLAAKPNVAAALLFGSNRRGVWVAALGGALGLVAVSLVLLPNWPREWLAILRTVPGMTFPIAHRGGPLLLLALLRWRRPEARLLLGLALVPQNMVIYETVPLFLIPRTFRESLMLALLSTLALAFTFAFVPLTPHSMVENYYQGDVLVALLYLPALIMILRRRNEGDLPTWLEHPTQRVRGVMQARMARART